MIKKTIIILIMLSFVLGASAMAASDPYYYKQWYLGHIRAEEAWTVSTGSSSVIVAVIDTGVDIDHPDLKENIWVNSNEIAGDGIDNDKNGYIDDFHGWNFVLNVPDPKPNLQDGYDGSAVSHGTFVSGLISAMHNNNFGIKGVTASVKIMPLLTLDATGYGGSEAVANAINYAVANGADIINLSFGGFEHSIKLRDSIINAYDNNVLIVAAIGNSTNSDSGRDVSNNPIYPICYDKEFSVNRILGVVATTEKRKITSYSNYGAGCADLGAPGDGIISLAYHNSNYSDFIPYLIEGWRGNSFSAAMVSGAAALLKSVDSSLTPARLIETLTIESSLMFVDSGKEGKVGKGILDVARALNKVSSSAPATVVQPSQTTMPALPMTVSGSQIAVATKAGGSGKIMTFNSQFQKISETEVFGGADFHGLNFKLADVDYNGVQDIVAAGVKGDQPFVRVINSAGIMLSSFLAYDINYRGGVQVAAGDVDWDGKVEIITAPQSGAVPLIKIFDLDGKLEKQFYAFNEKYTQGINIEVGDLDGDLKPEIVAAPHQGLLPKVKIFDGAGKLKKEHVVYTPAFTGGVNIGLADVNNDHVLDIVTGAGKGGGPHVQAFKYDGTRLASFMGFPASFREGVEVSGFDWNSDGKTDIVVAAGPPGGPHVKIFSQEGALLGEFFPLNINFVQGINIDVK